MYHFYTIGIGLKKQSAFNPRSMAVKPLNTHILEAIQENLLKHTNQLKE